MEINNTALSRYTRQTWEEWRSTRNHALTDPHGWLSLISFTWLSEEPTFIPEFPGRWHATNGKAIVSFADMDEWAYPITRDALPFSGSAEFELDESEADFSLSSGTRLAEVARKGGRYCVRVRDSASPLVKNFREVPIFDFSDDFVTVGTFISYGEPVDFIGGTARAGLSSHLTLVGDVYLSLGGTQFSLAATHGENGGLTLAFYDPTNGKQTASWRGVSIGAPEADGTCVVDFNRAWNYPCAFTPFGTCPRPYDKNIVPIPVIAGEKKPK